MKILHTADWHLGKLVQGVHMTEDQAYILEELIAAVETEKPDAVVIAGDLYDRAVPPTEAVTLLDRVLERLVLDLHTPVVAIAGNHDSPSRLHFASGIMQANGYHVTGELTAELEPVKLEDEHGEVHFHAIPYADPSQVRVLLDDDDIRTHDDAIRKLTERIKANMDPGARHVFVGHLFVTPHGEAEENTSDSERPLSIGGADHVSAEHFHPFHYTALGHLHQAHYVKNQTIRYAGSPLKYSSSEENHNKGYYTVELDQKGDVKVEKKLLTPKRDMRVIRGKIDDLLAEPKSDDYVFVFLEDETPVLSPMEKIRAVFPNAMHVQRDVSFAGSAQMSPKAATERHKMDHFSLFKAFYKEVKGSELTGEAEAMFKEVLEDFTAEERGE
ncbi:exonuclease SbcCD subunit D [Salisediminibacterium halotolerans]|uniref:exonuclease SbcCD subunit D n=1 Tax=Salisediminibacterium halotolerans TaxID=517425 RepID=UPI000EB5D3F5|nr:exonuclease SbcCD subunit D [Salisediminibacterium halotolerans]RLJ72222.1 exodeoxyribonuclease I subunit D [Actinophytocola xinjiangensis]RPE85435.1 exodeoxyribonuclease I subunit D [Salisediminibacterium halotolerans]TWG33392.1 exodeoxyribonuclease I subunit D [Salisediminibacterium halotolerans]GEL07077.1 nuclease SbcCD subunit D [Salisediminibacterium halotolerans]